MDRPFPISVESSKRPGDLIIEASFARTADDAVRIAIDDVIGAFAKLSAIGGLAGERLDPASARKTEAQTRLNSTAMRASFQNCFVDPAGLFVLVNMMHWLHSKISPIESLKIFWPAGQQIVSVYEPEFPGRWPRYSFELEIGDLNEDIDVEIELENSQPETVLKRVVDAMASWLLVTHRGGFANDVFAPAEL